MNATIKGILISLLLFTLVGCGAVAVKEPEYKILEPATVSLNIAVKYHEKWKATGEFDVFMNAMRYYRNAYELRPEDINIQAYYYDMQLLVAKNVEYEDFEEKLSEIYEKLDPLVRKKYSPPSLLAYTIGKDMDVSDAVQQQFLIKALKQSPQNPEVWGAASEHYSNLGNYYLSLAAAKKAWEVDSESTESANNLGVAYQLLAEDMDCDAQSKDYHQQSLKYYLDAVKRDSSSMLYLLNSAQGYSNIGLTPLASSQLKKVDVTGKDAVRPDIVGARIALIEGRYDHAAVIVKRLYESNALSEHGINWDATEVYFFTKLLQMLGYSFDYSFAKPPSSLVGWKNGVKPFFENFYEFTLGKSGVVSDEQALFDKPESLLSRRIRDVVENGESEIESDLFQCQKTSYYFALAAHASKVGDEASVKEYLAKVLNEKGYYSYEYLWAKAVLSL